MKKTKLGSILLRLVLGAAGFLALLLLGGRLWFRLPVSAYYQASEKAFRIPGLEDGFVPQGLEYLPAEEVFLVCGYQKNGAPSRVYTVDAKTGAAAGYVTLADQSGQPVSPHAGGLTIHGDCVFVAGDEEPCVYVYRLSDVLSASRGQSIPMLDRFATDFGGDGIRADFLCAAEDALIVGEFYREEDYPTPASHVFTNPSRETSHALALCFRYDPEGRFGLEEQPFMAYTLPALTQGLTIHDGKIWLSRSYATEFSTVSAYEPSAPFSALPADDGDIPLCPLDTPVLSLRLPPMAEEIVFVNGKLYTMYESASAKYYFGRLIGGEWCYATDVAKAIGADS